MMMGIGLALGTVGMETVAGYMRYTFKQPMLAQGIDFLPVAMGLFGISEVLMTAEQPEENVSLQQVRFWELWPTLDEWRRSFWPMIRGSFIGFFTGLIPGPSPVIALCCPTHRAQSGQDRKFAGPSLAGPAANNAAVGISHATHGVGHPLPPAMA
jgi:putative tricarboxylic transport membrane protein